MWSHFEKGKWLCQSCCLGLFAMESWFVVKGFSMLVCSQGNSFVCLWRDAAALNWLCVICLLGKVIFVLVVLSVLDLSLISVKSSRHATILNPSCVLLVARNFCFLLDRGLIYSTPSLSVMHSLNGVISCSFVSEKKAIWSFCGERWIQALPRFF